MNILLNFESKLAKELLDTLDRKLFEIRTDCNNVYDPDAVGYFDSAEHTIGLGFVTLQTYIVATYGILHIDKIKALSIGPTHSNGTTFAKIVNDAANFWKHNNEWSLEKNEKRKEIIKKTFMKVGSPIDTDYPLCSILKELTAPQETSLGTVFYHLKKWQNELIKTVSEQDHINKNVEKDWEKFLNPKEIKRNLIDASLYLSFYEILKTAIVDRIKQFYTIRLQDGKTITSKQYKETILNRKIKGKTNIFFSSCLWLIENDVISQDENNIIVRIKEHRNEIAHDLLKFLIDSKYIIDKDLFNQIKALTLKIEMWWILEFEIPVNPDFDDQEIDTERIVPTKKLLLDYIFEMANRGS